MIFLPALATIAADFGWRAVSLTVAGVAMLVVFPIVALVVRDRPQSIGLQPYGAPEPVPVPPRAERPFRPAFEGLRLGAASRDFWLLCATFFVCGLSTNGLIGTHLIPAAVDHHMSEVAGASFLAIIGAFDVVGTTASGWLTDRYDPRKLLATYYALRGLAVVALPYAFGSTAALGAFAVFYGLDWVATVPPTVAISADIFGRERAGVVFAWVFASHQLGAAAAAWAAGASRSAFGTYTPAFITAGVLCVAAAALSTRIRVRQTAAVPALA
jgi:predicted MFS family arabinose efflux permease